MRGNAPVVVGRFCETPALRKPASAAADALQFRGASGIHYAAINEFAQYLRQAAFVAAVVSTAELETGARRGERLYTWSLPFPHLLRERALRAIRIILEAKIFVNLKKTLLMRDGFQKFLPARIISEKTCRSCFEPSIG